LHEAIQISKPESLMTAILVTGGAGYIGNHTCKTLRRNGFNPVTYDNLCRGNSDSVKWSALEIGERFGFVHVAAFTHVGE
jgi:UDP-glucose 4-epimerase